MSPQVTSLMTLHPFLTAIRYRGRISPFLMSQLHHDGCVLPPLCLSFVDPVRYASVPDYSDCGRFLVLFYHINIVFVRVTISLARTIEVLPQTFSTTSLPFDHTDMSDTSSKTIVVSNVITFNST